MWLILSLLILTTLLRRCMMRYTHAFLNLRLRFLRTFEVYTTSKKENILKFLVTAKTEVTRRPKKSFPIYVDHLQFLTSRAGRVVTKVYCHYTFEQECLKKDFVLGN